MATLTGAQQMNVKFTFVQNDTNEEMVQAFDETASFDDIRAAAAAKAGENYILGYMDEDDDFVVIGTQDEWQERMSQHTEGDVDVVVRFVSAETADDALVPQGETQHDGTAEDAEGGDQEEGEEDEEDDEEATLTRAFFVLHGMKGGKHGHGKGKGMHHFGKGKGCKRGRDWFARGSKPDAEHDSDNEDDADESCKRMKTDEAWAWCHFKGHGKGMMHGMKKGGKHGHGMKGCKGAWHFEMPEHDAEWMMHGMKGGKHGHGMKGCKGAWHFEMPEHDAEWMMHGMKGMKGGKHGKGCKDGDFDMAEDDHHECFKGMKGGKHGHGMKGCKGGMKGKGGKGCDFEMPEDDAEWEMHFDEPEAHDECFKGMKGGKHGHGKGCKGAKGGCDFEMPEHDAEWEMHGMKGMKGGKHGHGCKGAKGCAFEMPEHDAEWMMHGMKGGKHGHGCKGAKGGFEMPEDAAEWMMDGFKGCKGGKGAKGEKHGEHDGDEKDCDAARRGFGGKKGCGKKGMCMKGWKGACMARLHAAPFMHGAVF